MPTSFSDWFGVLELPFLLMAIFFAFRTANALKGGVFGRGMMFLAWGFTVMGIGHINMQSAKLFNVDLIATVFGEFGGAFVWVVALILTWGLSWLGFHSIYRAGRGTKKLNVGTVAAES